MQGQNQMGGRILKKVTSIIFIIAYDIGPISQLGDPGIVLIFYTIKPQINVHNCFIISITDNSSNF